jgi:hypothetical protein
MRKRVALVAVLILSAYVLCGCDLDWTQGLLG